MGFFSWFEKKIVNPIVNVVTGVVGEVVSWFIDIPEAPDFVEQQQGFLVNKNSNIGPIPVIYGERKIAGTRVFVATSGSNNNYLYMAIVLCEGEVEEIGDVYIDDTLFEIGSKYWGNVLINKYVGTDTQTADSTLVNANIGWTNNHRLQGLAYIAVRLTYNRDVFSGIPNIACIVKGKKVLDTRTSTTAYSTNPAMCLRDYLTNTRYGKGLSASLIDTASFNQAANDCDTLVSKYTGQPEDTKIYECNAIIDTSQKLFDNVSIFLRGMRGIMPFQNGVYRLLFEKDTASTFSFNEDNMIGGIVVSSVSKDRIYNKVTAKFVNPDANWQTDAIIWPPAESSEETQFLSEDANYELSTEIDLPTITSSYAARDIARLVCLASRKEKLNIAIEATTDAIKIAVGDIVDITHQTPQWTAKKFRVVSMQIMSQGTIQLSLQEHVPSIYPWEVQAEVPAVVESNLPNPFLVQSINIITVTPSAFIQPDGTSVPIILVEWTASVDQFVTHYELQYRRNTGDYESILTEETRYTIYNVRPTDTYDVRIRAVNSFGIRSAFAAVDGNTAVNDTVAPSAPTGLSAVGGTNQISLFWTNPSDSDFDLIQIWEGTSSVQGNATLIATTKASSFVRGGLSNGVTRFYWIKAVDYTGNISLFNSETGVSATTVVPLEQGDVIGTIEVVDELTADLGAADIGKVEFLTTDQKLYRWNGVDEWITGVVIDDVSGSITADRIDASTLSAISADMGTITAGSISAELITSGLLSAQRISIDGVTLDRSDSDLIIKNGGVGTVKLVANAATDLVSFTTSANDGEATHTVDFPMDNAGDISAFAEILVIGAGGNDAHIELFMKIENLDVGGFSSRTLFLDGIIAFGPKVMILNRLNAVNGVPAGNYRLTVQTLNASNISSLASQFRGTIIKRYR